MPENALKANTYHLCIHLAHVQGYNLTYNQLIQTYNLKQTYQFEYQ